ncbi:MAG TPA: pyridoxal-dependent decarboxylase [Thermoanaerobaculia bacterium]|nr:pyridoxal-dependent decarboxylase [Thermoanaerobaculia bacterium]
MTPDEFRRHGAEVVEWIARYMERVEELPVLSRVAPGEVRAQLPPHPPEQGEHSLAAMLADVDRIVLPGVTHWQSPGFFAYFPSNASGPAILGELLSAGLGVQGMLWSTSPACTELETHVMDWLVEALGLPAAFRSDGPGGGVIQDTASSAVLCAILAARERTTDGAGNARGGDGSVTVYCSTQTHSSVEKGVAIAGIGRDNLRAIAVDSAFAMRPDELAAAIAADRAASKRPSCVVASVGTTSSNAIDPVAAIAEVCRRHQGEGDQAVWLHVDAAMSGTAALCPELRWIHDGVEDADSYCFNPHKWMLTTFDCSAFWVRDRRPLLAALSILPEYLRNAASESGAVIDYRDWHVQLGRRFRALKLWFVLRWYGLEGLRAMVRAHVALARRFADRVAADAEWELAAPVPLNLVCFRHRGGDAVNQRAMERVNASGEAYLTHTKLDGKLTLRLCVGQARTEARHVERAWELLRAAVASA